MTTTPEPMPPHDPSYNRGPAGSAEYAPPAHPRNGIGITALVLGIVAVIASITVIGGILNLPPNRGGMDYEE
jgi:hypothetical protein